MLVSKLKPCKCKFTPRIRTGETANGSGTGPNPRDRNPPRWRRWITVAILELIHVTQAAIGRRVVVVVAFLRVGTRVDRSGSRRYILDWDRCAFFRPPVCVLPLLRLLRRGCNVALAGLLWAARSALVTLDNSLVDRTGFYAWRRVSRGSALSTVDGRLSAYRGYYG